MFERFGEDLVVLNLRSGQYLGFNVSGALVWRALSRGEPASKVLSAGMLQQALEPFLSALIANELLVAQTSTDIELEPALKAELALASDAATVEVYENLVELIKADPIHDIDVNTGWPNRPAT